MSKELPIPLTSIPVPTPTPTPIERVTITDWSLVEAKFTSIKQYLAPFGGKKEHNPYIYWNTYCKPLHDKFKQGIRTQELYDTIMNFQVKVPTIDSFPDQNTFTTLDKIPTQMREIQQDKPPVDIDKLFEGN